MPATDKEMEMNENLNNSGEILVDVNNLHVSFPLPEGTVKAVHGVSYQIKRGKVLGVVGESGSGKSVTTQAMLRIIPKPGVIDEGQIDYYREPESDAIDLLELNPRGKEINQIRGGDISLVFQEPMSAFSPMHTIGKQMIEFLQLHRNLTKIEAREIAVDMLAKVGISNPSKRVDQYSFEMSGGMRQRAMIALALSAGPKLVIADEPTTSLDVTIQAQILQLMKDLQQENGMSILFITHNLGVVAQIADEIAVMYLGNIVEYGKTRNIFKNPRHPYTVNLLKAIPVIGQGNRRLTAIKGQIPSPFERPTGCQFHTRCPRMIPGICEKHMPYEVEVDTGHTTRCWHYCDRKNIVEDSINGAKEIIRS